MVYPFVIPFDVALLLYVLFYSQWHTITIKECHGHFSCRWIVLQSLAQSSRSAQKKHRHHNSFGVYAWQNSNHLGWIELTQFMGFWIICRYFLTMWPVYSLASQDRGSIGPSPLQATPRRKLRPTAATFAVEEPESEPVKRRKCPREVQARFEIHQPAVGRKKNAFNHFNHFHHPISNKTPLLLNKRW